MMEFNADPGELCERITIRAPSTAKDAVGQDVVTWTDATQWAKHAPINAGGREVLAAGQKTSEQPARFIIRSRSDITPAWRILWNGIEYNIITVTQPNRTWTDLLCIRGTP